MVPPPPTESTILFDLGYAIAMMIVGVSGLRFTLKNCFSIDIFDFTTLPAQIAAGVVGLVLLWSIYSTLSDQKKIRALGRQILGKQAVANINTQRAQLQERVRPMAM